MFFQLFKNVAERGQTSKMLMEAHAAYKAGNVEGALLKYAMLAELGYEVAQSNVAYILDYGQCFMPWLIWGNTTTFTHGRISYMSFTLKNVCLLSYQGFLLGVGLYCNVT